MRGEKRMKIYNVDNNVEDNEIPVHSYKENNSNNNDNQNFNTTK